MLNENFFGKKLVELRKQHGFTQAQLAKNICINVKSIKNWETGVSDPSAESIVTVAKYFHISADELLGLSQAKEVIIIPDTIPEKERKRIIRTIRAALQIYMGDF